MSFDAHVLKVLIASPGDTRAEREAVTNSLYGWNSARAEREQIVLLPKKWETDSVPRLGGSAQSIINEQLVDSADIVIALFDSRVGMATSSAVSGTAEEIERAHSAGKPVHVYFSDEPIPRDADLKQVKALRSFKGALSALGLLGSYASPEDLSFQVRQAIESDLELLNLGVVTRRSSAAEHAVLRATYTFDREQEMDSKGRTRNRTRRERLVVTNSGAVPAENVTLRIEGLDHDSDPPTLHGDAKPTIIPNSDFSWSLISHMGTSRAVVAIMTWNEGSEEFTEKQHVAL